MMMICPEFVSWCSAMRWSDAEMGGQTHNSGWYQC
jgi:hypothetical protein